MFAPSDPMQRPRRLLRSPIYAMGQLARAAAARLDRALNDEGLSLRTHQVLACLADFGQVSQSQVCDAIVVDRSDMVRLVDRLEELGQVVRERDAEDRRRHLLTLTPAGQSALQRGERVIERVTGEVLSNLSTAERQTLHRLALQALGEPTDLIADAPPEPGRSDAPRGAERAAP